MTFREQITQEEIDTPDLLQFNGGQNPSGEADDSVKVGFARSVADFWAQVKRTNFTGERVLDLLCGQGHFHPLLGSTGTTWFNLVHVSHSQHFYVEPPDRVWMLAPEKRPYACLTHHPDRSIWDGFFSNYDPERRLQPQLSEFIGGKTIIMNHPTPQFFDKELTPNVIDLRQVLSCRRRQAVINSAARHLASRYPDFTSTMINLALPATRWLKADYESKRATSIIQRYKNVVHNPTESPSRHESFFGHHYEDDWLQFWRFVHHPTAGNTGSNDDFRRMQRRSTVSHRHKEYYDKVAAQLKEDSRRPVPDPSWMKNTTRRDRLACDTVVGKLHAQFECDEFDEEERKVCAMQLALNSSQPY